jgi:hypothetical protein
MAPGEEDPWHFHPADLYAVILEGELTEDRGCGIAPSVYGPGAAFHEAPGVVHRVRNTGSVVAGVFVTAALPICYDRFADSIAAAGPVCGDDGPRSYRVPSCEQLSEQCSFDDASELWICPDDLIQPCN